MMQFIESGGEFKQDLSSNGKIMFTKCEISDRVSFLDYIMGGCEINVSVAIDYTMSNGEIGTP
jgi:hypothetical protein